MNGTKSWYTSKTLWFSVLYGLVAVAGLFGFAGFQPSADTVEIVSIVSAVIVFALRTVTNKGLTL